VLLLRDEVIGIEVGLLTGRPGRREALARLALFQACEAT
jgi:hypothetical protein